VKRNKSGGFSQPRISSKNLCESVCNGTLASECTANRRGTLPRDRAADEPHAAYNVPWRACKTYSMQRAACSAQH
jgi:hypothetical protein